MNRNKRVSSCPNFVSKFTRRTARIPPSHMLLEKIQKLFHQCNPRVLGHPVNLSDLFISVILRGGYRSVCDKRKWNEVAEDLRLPTACLNICVGLRRLYYQFLSSIELSEYPDLSESFLVQNIVELPSSESLNSKFSSILLTPVERNLGICHIDVTDIRNTNTSELYIKSSGIQQFPHSRGQLEKMDSPVDSILVVDSDLPDPMRFRELTELRQSELALASGLHNEVDAGLNCLLALSVAPLPPAHGMVSNIRLSRCSNLLYLVLASVGIFDYDECSRQLCSSIWVQQNRLNFFKFWNSVVRNSSGRVFLEPDVFVSGDLPSESPRSASSDRLFAPSDFPHPLRTVDYHTTATPSLDNQIDPSVDESPEASRALLVATLLVNLVTPPSGLLPMNTGEEGEDIDDCELTTNNLYPTSLSPASSPLAAWKDNARLLAASPSLLRFAFLCAHAHHSGLRQMGLQLLSQLRFPLEPLLLISDVVEMQTGNLPACRLADFSLTLLNNCLFESEDRANLLSGLGLLANLARVSQRCNETSLLTGLSPSLWLRLVELVCLPDLAVVCASLEALRCLTGMGAIACHCCWQACCCSDSSSTAVMLVPTRLVQPLLALVTIEGQAMGSQSLHRIKLMRRPVNYPVVLQAPHAQQPTGHHQPHSQYRSMPLSPVLSVLSGGHSQTRLAPGKPTPVLSQAPRPHHYSFGVGSPPSPQHAYPARVAKPTQLSPPVVSVQPKPPSTSCTSLINLLASPSVASNSIAPVAHQDDNRQRIPLPPQMAVSTAVGTCPITTNTGGDCGAIPLQQPLGVTTTTTAFGTPSAKCPPSPSELTDRLQMPPPSLPPPSALRRSGRWSLPRPGGGTPGSPTNSRVRCSSNSCNSPPAAAPRDICGVGGGDCGMECRADDQSSSVTQKSNSTSTLDSPTRSSFPSFSGVTNSISESPTSSESKPFPLDTTTEDTMDSSVKMNGGWSSSSSEGEEDESGEDEVEQEDVKKTEPFSLRQPQPNGVKPSILQAAIVALHEGKIEMPRSRLLNGTIGENGDGEEFKPWFVSNVEAKKATKPSNADNPTKVEAPPSVIDCQQHIFNTNQIVNGHAADSPGDHDDSVDRVKVDQDTVPMVNGDVESTTGVMDARDASSEGSSSSDSSSTSDTSPLPSLPVRRRLFKRRRRKSARTRWAVHKRRKEYGGNYTQSPDKAVTGGSPLKPLPLDTSESIPGSVLDPSWTPPHSLTVPAGQQRRCASSDELVHHQHATPTEPPRDSQAHHHRPSSSENVMRTENLPRVPPTPPKYLCEWESCCCSFDSHSQVSPHVYTAHLLQQPVVSANDEVRAADHRETGSTRPIRRCCRWRGCQSAALPRAPFALMTHVLDYHCAKSELELRRREAAVSAQTPQPGGDTRSMFDTSSCPLPLRESPHSAAGADQTALSIVRQLEVIQFQTDVWAAHHHYTAVCPFSRQPPKFLPHLPPTGTTQNVTLVPPPREGPVTKHLRVTAALILRNLVTHLPEARRWLLSETPLLSDLVMGCSPNDSSLRTNDASHIIAQCLAICTKSSPSSVTVASSPKPHTQPIRSFQQNHHYHQHHQKQPGTQLRRLGWQPRTTIRIPLPPVDMDAS